jgi:hypothetical protein
MLFESQRFRKEMAKGSIAGNICWSSKGINQVLSVEHVSFPDVSYICLCPWFVQGIVKKEGDRPIVATLNPAAQKLAASLLDFSFQLQLPVSILNLLCWRK